MLKIDGYRFQRDFVNLYSDHIYFLPLEKRIQPMEIRIRVHYFGFSLNTSFQPEDKKKSLREKFLKMISEGEKRSKALKVNILYSFDIDIKQSLHKTLP